LSAVRSNFPAISNGLEVVIDFREIVNFTKIYYNSQTIRAEQLFELSNFVFINEGRNRPLN